MSSTVRAIRAIMAVYAKSILWPVLWLGIGGYVVVMVIIGWIASVASPWWWLLATLPTAILLVGLAVWTVLFLLATRLAPNLTKRQLQAAKRFIGRINRAAEHLGTPRFILIGRVIRDIVFPPSSGQTFIGELAHEPGEMRREFEEMRELF